MEINGKKVISLKESLAESVHQDAAWRAWYQNEYLKSDHWKNMQRIVLKRAEGLCERCGVEVLLEVHHKHYQSLENEDPAKDLIALCFECHAAEHNRTESSHTRRDMERIPPSVRQFREYHALRLLNDKKRLGMRFDEWKRQIAKVPVVFRFDGRTYLAVFSPSRLLYHGYAVVKAPIPVRVRITDKGKYLLEELEQAGVAGEL